MKNKNFIVNLSITIVVAILTVVLSVTSVLEKLELRTYDGMTHLLKDPEMSDDIILLQIADDDINLLGDWPWSRNILGDSLIRMKELGVAAAIFDIEYISPSPKAVASNAEENINNQIYETQKLSSELLKAIPQSLEGGYPAEELNNLADELIQYNLSPAYSELYDYVLNHVAADNDEYFGKCCQFFENTYLTVNTQDLGYDSISQEDVDYIRNRMLTYKVDDENNYIAKDNLYTFKETYAGKDIGFTPALHTMIKRAKGVGFTNSNVDKDNTRRRMELFYEYDGKYLGQLVFGPLMSILDTQSFTRTKNSLILHDALYPGKTEREDVVIPLDNHGCILINWQHESNPEIAENLYGINYENVFNLKYLDDSEKNIVTNLGRIYDEYVIFEDDGYPMEYLIEIYDLLNYYDELEAYKAYLLSKCTGYDVNGNAIDGVLPEEYDEYYSLRADFFKTVKEFTEKDHLNQINAKLDLLLGDSEDEQMYRKDLNDVFTTIKSDINYYLTNFEKLKNKFNGKYCIIGQTAASTTDIGGTPFVKQYYNVCIHANIMNTVLTKNFIHYYPWYYGFIATLILSLVLLLLSNKSSTIQNLVGGIARIVLIIIFVVLFVGFGIYTPLLVSVVIFTILDYLSGVVYRYLMSSREKKFITQVAASFANKDTVEQLKKHPELFTTKGEKKVITALFSDVQKFSTLSEALAMIYGDEAPSKLVEILNEYLGDMSNEILFNAGTIDKYEGDAIISMFGAPDTMNMHTKEEWAYLCLDSAIRMKKQEEIFNSTHKELFEPVEVTDSNGNKKMVALKPLQTRIGINSGEAYVGMMGSKTKDFSKLNYTMMGDTVNLASRLEGVNKFYSSWIMCSDDTWNLANTGEHYGKITVKRLDKVRVVGRSTPVQLYNVVGFTDELSPEVKQEIEMFHAAMDKYLERDFVTAGQMFLQASASIGEDPTALMFAGRCKEFIENGVDEDWDGVRSMTSK